MLTFFYNLFTAIIRGEWISIDSTQIIERNTTLFNRVASLVVNALGGNYETAQTIVLLDSNLTITHALGCILSLIATVMVCMLTFKLTKMVFSIFFGGR